MVLIVRIPHTQRYDITPLGKRVALFFTKLHARLIRPGLSQLFDGCPKAPNRPLAKAIHGLDSAFERFITEAKLAASAKKKCLQAGCYGVQGSSF